MKWAQATQPSRYTPNIGVVTGEPVAACEENGIPDATHGGERWEPKATVQASMREEGTPAIPTPNGTKGHGKGRDHKRAHVMLCLGCWVAVI